MQPGAETWNDLELGFIVGRKMRHLTFDAKNNATHRALRAGSLATGQLTITSSPT